MSSFLESYPELSGSPFVKTLAGYFTTVDGAAPTGLSMSQKGAATVARTGEGVWTITLTEQYATILHATAQMVDTASLQYEDRITSISGKVVTYQHREATNDAATVLAAQDNPGKKVFFRVTYLIANTVLDSV